MRPHEPTELAAAGFKFLLDKKVPCQVLAEILANWDEQTPQSIGKALFSKGEIQMDASDLVKLAFRGTNPAYDARLLEAWHEWLVRLVKYAEPKAQSPEPRNRVPGYEISN